MCNNHNAREFDHTVELADNAMLKVRPELFYEWDFEKNDELGLDVYKVKKGSTKKVWWVCHKCKSSFDASMNNRTKQNCPYCSSKKVNHTNSLASLNHELAKEWHPILNDELTPHDVTCNSNKEVWWLGKCGHEWKASISNRNKNGGCPYCSGHKVLKGFNDIWTTNPEIAKLLVDSADGYIYSKGSHKKINWKCPNCGEIIKNKTIKYVIKRGLSCHICSDGKSYPEKVIYNLLRQLNITFECEKTFTWAKSKRYDFYLPDHNMIIEVNGRQHYEKAFGKMGGRTLKEEQGNDKIKEKIARENGIEKYIVIDATYSEIDYIKNNIMRSELTKHFNLIDVNWHNINEESLNSLAIKTIDLWNDGYNLSEVSNELRIGRASVRRYLKMGRNSGLCEYDEIKVKKKAGSLIGKIQSNRNKKPIIQLSLEKYYIKEWESISEASRHTATFDSNISRCCKGIYKSAGGYKWMYKEDYDKLIHNKEAI